MHSAGRTRLPPASIEYLMASSSPPSRASSVNLSPCRYSSKARLCPSHRVWLRVPLAPLAMLHPAVRAYLRPPQDPANERRRLVAREASCELHGFVYCDVSGDVVHVEHLVEREAQDRTVHPTETSESTASSCPCSASTPRASLTAYSSKSPLYSRQRSIVGPSGLSLTSLWYRFRNACFRAVRRLKGLSSPRSSDPRQVFVGARVHPYSVADVDEKRHLYHDPGLQSSRLVPA